MEIKGQPLSRGNVPKAKPPPSGVAKKTKPKLVDLQNIPEPKRKQPQAEESKLISTDNPWADDSQPQYHIDVGGVQKFLHFRATLIPSKPVVYTPAGPDIDLMHNIELTLEKLDQIRTLTENYNHAHAMINYSDLLLSKSTQERAQTATKLASFLALITKNKEHLLEQLNKASKLSENCLVLSKVFHQDFISLL